MYFRISHNDHRLRKGYKKIAKRTTDPRVEVISVLNFPFLSPSLLLRDI